MDVSMGSFPKIFIKTIFWNNNWRVLRKFRQHFSRTSMNTSEWMRKHIPKCLDHLVDFYIAFKLCHKTIGTKPERNVRYSSNRNWAREKHLIKQILQSLQGLGNVH